MRRGCPAMASQRLASVARAAPKRKDRDRVSPVASKVWGSRNRARGLSSGFKLRPRTG